MTGEQARLLPDALRPLPRLTLDERADRHGTGNAAGQPLQGQMLLGLGHINPASFEDMGVCFVAER